jgi:hypothetical protein
MSHHRVFGFGIGLAKTLVQTLDHPEILMVVECLDVEAETDFEVLARHVVAMVLHHKAFQRAETTEGLEQWFETSICFPALFEDLACVSQGLGKSLPIIRFQEIVNSVHFECTNGMRIVSRDGEILARKPRRLLRGRAQ